MAELYACEIIIQQDLHRRLFFQCLRLRSGAASEARREPGRLGGSPCESLNVTGKFNVEYVGKP